MEKFKTTDVFTPSKPATITFVERNVLTEQLVNAIWTPGKQIVVYGHSGSGKTTLLLNKLQQTRDYWIKCSCTSDTTLDSLVLDAFDKLGPFYRKEISNSKTESLSSNITSEYLGIKASISAKLEDRSDEKFERVLPPQLTIQRLVDFLGQAGALWVVDDFHKLANAEKTRFAQTLKMFVDAAADYDDLKVVAIGAVDTAREVIEYDPEMRNRISEIHVPLMTRDELEQVISIGESRLHCTFDSPYKRSITEFSSGLAAVCHQLCLNVCFAANLLQTSTESNVVFTDEHLKSAIERYLADTSDSLKSVYDRAIRRKKASKWDNSRIIVSAMVDMPMEGAIYSTILEQIQKSYPDYPQGNLTTYLGQLQSEDRGAILRLDANSGFYSFSNPFYRAYSQIMEKPVLQKKLEFRSGVEFQISVTQLLGNFEREAQNLVKRLEQKTWSTDKRGDISNQ